MPVFPRSPFVRFSLPLCFLFTAAVSCILFSKTVTVKESHDVANTTSVISQHQDFENWKQEKAERVLAAFGESNPVVVVSVELEVNISETEVYAPNPDLCVVQSVQKTEEIVRETDEAPLQSSTAKPAAHAAKYKNCKVSEDRKIGYSKIKSFRRTPKLCRVSCAVVVSKKNEGRRKEIKKAVATALGLQFERGDSVFVTVR